MLLFSGQRVANADDGPLSYQNLSKFLPPKHRKYFKTSYFGPSGFAYQMALKDMNETEKNEY